MIKEKYSVLRDREQLMTPAFWNAEGRTKKLAKQIHGKMPSVCYLVYLPNNRVRWLYLKKENDSVSKNISNKLYSDRNYFNRLKTNQKKAEKGIFALNKKIDAYNLENLEWGELASLVAEIKNMWLVYDIFNTPAWIFGADLLKEKIAQRLQIPEDDFLFLTTPLEKTETNKLDLEFLIFLQKIKNKQYQVEKAAEKLSAKFGWIPFGYDGPEYWNKEHFVKKIKKELHSDLKKIDNKINEIKNKDREQKSIWRRLIKKHGINKRDVGLVNTINDLAIWTDKRKAFHYPLHYRYANIIKEISKRTGWSYELLKSLLVEELIELSDKNKANKLKKIAQERYRGNFVIEVKNSFPKKLSPKKAKKLLGELEAQTNFTVIKGMVASKGSGNIYKGTVKVLASAREIGKVKKGDFIVATMTTPDYIIGMQKASGFITDEGGVTCHAAIVGREMGKPAIIGTRVATQILKDGDKIEIDTKTGTVKKI